MTQRSNKLHPELLGKLASFRRARCFHPKSYIERKVGLLSEYFGFHGITAAVVGVSGGIDSAVVLGLFARLAQRPSSPLVRVIPALLPVFSKEGATNQDTALSRGRELVESLDLDPVKVDLSDSLESMKAAGEKGFGALSTPWATGQLVSYIRTPALYYIATLSTAEGFPCVLAGTTNRDEGSYIGFFGKASDGMVDIQPISDIHKSEVYAVARELGVPRSVIEATPTGDTFDGRTDEEMTGFSYDFLELYEHFLCMDDTEKQRKFIETFGTEALAEWQELASRVEKLHRHNLHKYLGGSPAVHFDIFRRSVPGGWREEPSSGPAPDRNPLADTEWMSTPYDKIVDRGSSAPAARPLAVLLTTGAFCPIHSGHITMMDDARRAVEEKGFSVLGGYISPSHDEYVLEKCGMDAPKAAHRVALCQEAVKDSDWLMVDSWESLHTDREYYFTEVIGRLERYLQRHCDFGRPIHVFYVYGGDNADFALESPGLRNGVCVLRPGYEQDFRAIQDNEVVKANPNIIMCESSACSDASSSRIREGDTRSLPEGIKGVWGSWLSPRKTEGSARICLRNEGLIALDLWSHLVEEDRLKAAWSDFIAGLTATFKASFYTVQSPDSPFHLEVILQDLGEQLERAQSLVAGDPCISLDPFVKGDVNIGVSRCFPLAATNATRKLVPRPGWDDIDTQLANIPAGEYVVLDDDTATGFTLRNILGRLPSRCKVTRIEHFAAAPDLKNGQISPDVVDLGDCRDFLIGSREGGLVVELPSRALARVPYCLPYVQPSYRQSVPPSSDIRFSRAIWNLNVRFFEALGYPLKVSDASHAFQSLALYLGFAPSTPLVDVCKWHIHRLDRRSVVEEA